MVSKLSLSQWYSLVSSASPPLLLGNLPWVFLNCFTASRVASHLASSLFVLPSWLPYLETGGWVGQAGNQIRNSANSKDEAKWDAILEAVKLFKRTHGRFPRYSGGKDERRLYECLRKCSDRTMQNWTQERANKLVLAFGDRWQSECFPNSIWFW